MSLVERQAVYLFGRLGEFGQTEICKLGMTVVGYKNIGRFHISMKDSCGMSSREAVRNPHQELERFAPGALFAQPFGQRSSIHQLGNRSEEHTSELQSRQQLLCRLLLGKKK